MLNAHSEIMHIVMKWSVIVVENSEKEAKVTGKELDKIEKMCEKVHFINSEIVLALVHEIKEVRRLSYPE